MLENYYKHSKQEDPEPQFICRHRLLHGIITRDVTAADCLKLFLIIRSFAYLERLFIVAEKLIKYNSLTLHTEDRLLFGDEEYEKITKKSREFIELNHDSAKCVLNMLNLISKIN